MFHTQHMPLPSPAPPSAKFWCLPLKKNAPPVSHQEGACGLLTKIHCETATTTATPQPYYIPGPGSFTRGLILLCFFCCKILLFVMMYAATRAGGRGADHGAGGRAARGGAGPARAAFWGFWLRFSGGDFFFGVGGLNFEIT